MKKDYSELSFFELKTECKKQGLFAKGTKVELLKRLNGENSTKEQQKEVVEKIERSEKKIEAPSPTPDVTSIEALQPYHNTRVNKLASFKPDVRLSNVPDPEFYKEWVNDERFEILDKKLSIIASGKGTWKFYLDPQLVQSQYPNNDKVKPGSAGAYQVEFTGRLHGNQSTTLIDTDQQILTYAGYYFNNRYETGKNNQKTVF